MLPEWIVAVDPGKMTGWCLLDLDGFMESRQLPAMDAVERIDYLIEDQDRVHIVVERFDISMRTVKLSRQPDALDVIGALRYIAHKQGHAFIRQARADRNRVTDQMLRRSNIYSPGNEHANDASKHALSYFAKVNPEGAGTLLQRVLREP